MPINPRITGRPRPENDPKLIRDLMQAIRAGELDLAITLMDRAPDIVPRVNAMHIRGDHQAGAVMYRYSLSHPEP